MCADGDKILTGKKADKVSVKAEVVAHGKADKIVVFKYNAKKNIRKKTRSQTAVH